MTRSPLLSGALLVLVLSVALAGQTAQPSADSDLPVGPRTIAGAATSARHCVSGDAANVYGLGWVESGTSYTITFDSEITLVTGVSRLNLSGNAATSAFGTPDVRFTASTPGSMALYVGARGQAGCYRYKVEIQPPARSVAPASESRTPPAVALVKPAKSPIRTWRSPARRRARNSA